jgi:hypothetical protein
MLDETLEIRALVFVVLGPISLLACLLNIITLLALQKRRVQSDIQIMASIYQSMVAINIIFDGAYLISEGRNITEDSMYCKVGAYLQMSGMWGNFTYSFMFSLLVGEQLSVSLRKRPSQRMTLAHVITTIIIMGLPTLYIELGAYGYNEMR